MGQRNISRFLKSIFLISIIFWLCYNATSNYFTNLLLFKFYSLLILIIFISLAFLLYLKNKTLETTKYDIFLERHIQKIKSIFVVLIVLNFLFYVLERINFQPLSLLNRILEGVSFITNPLLLITIIFGSIIIWYSKEEKKNHSRNKIIFSIILVLIFATFVLIRFGLPTINSGSFVDEYFHISNGMSFSENGHFANLKDDTNNYNRGYLVSLFVGIMFSFFKNSIFVAKLVPAILGIFSFIFSYLILVRFIKDKITTIISLLIITFNPLIIFNHFYIRMYILYELFFMLNIFLFFSLIKYLGEKKWYKISFFSILIILVNLINYFFAYDSGRYVILILSGVFMVYIYLFSLKKINIENKYFNFFNYLFRLSLKYKIISLVLLVPIVFFSLGLNTKLGWLFSNTLTVSAQNNHGFFNLFFYEMIILTIFFLMSLIIIFKTKNLYIKLFLIASFIVFGVHIVSDKGLQLTRTILYFLPVYAISSSIAYTKILKIYKKNYLTITLFSLILVVSLLGMYLNGFINKPQIAGEVWYVEYKDAYDYIRDNHANATLFSAVTQPYISELYNVKTDYYLNLTQNETSKNYYDEENEFYFSKIKAIEDPIEFLNMSLEKPSCVIIREPNRATLLGKEGEMIISYIYKNVANYKFISIYCRE